MSENPHLRPADIPGAARLLVDATIGVTDLVERTHSTIYRVPGIFGPIPPMPVRGISGLVYRSIRGIAGVLGNGVELAGAFISPEDHAAGYSEEREVVLAAMNGVVGDYLADTGNSLAIPLQFRHAGQALVLDPAALTAALPQAGSRVLLMVHGLCLNDCHWQVAEHNHGSLLAAEFGYTPVYLRYNSGRHISLNGEELAAHIEELLKHWPVPVDELAIVAHSMGGLIARSACHYAALADHRWLRPLRRMLFLGTPHHGAPLERYGNGLHGLLNISPYSAAFTRLAGIRSAGVTDLRYGNMCHEDWHGRDRFAHTVDQRQALPLPAAVQCYAIAATTGTSIGDLSDRLLGDGLVPLRSALGQHSNPRLALEFPTDRQWIGCEMNHMELLYRPEVYAQMRHWFAENPA
jgi:pimeloyl-ACP methyl ester carboxylesterase